MGTWIARAELPEPAVDLAAWPAGFTDLYRAELGAVTAVVYAICNNRFAAEDLAQDAFVIVQRHWDRVSEYDSPAAFVRRVAINLARSRGRRLAAETRALARYAWRQPVRVTALDPMAAEFWAEVRRLPRRQAEVTVLRYAADLSDAEIADVLGCSESTVRVHAHRARLVLAERLGHEEPE